MKPPSHPTLTSALHKARGALDSFQPCPVRTSGPAGREVSLPQSPHGRAQATFEADQRLLCTAPICFPPFAMHLIFHRCDAGPSFHFPMPGMLGATLSLPVCKHWA